ncbi:MAG: endolytic transglycosylase MltG [Patescibacteria group bacterium]|nr:endolytic transglycosylase MltG [Patescibacteria group bacterium]
MAKTNFQLLISFAALSSLICFLAVWYVYVPSSGGKSAIKEVVIEKGSGLGQIAAVLKEAGLIKSKLAFEAYAVFSGKRKSIQAGVYEIDTGLNMRGLLRILAVGETKKLEITVPEGWTAKEILAVLVEKKIIKPADSSAVDIFQAKEGFLFPDTYEFNPGALPAEILAVMLGNFGKKVNNDLRAEIEKQGRTLRDIVTMASILEKEVKTYGDKQLAAGILWKRLENSWYLQVDSAPETYHNKGLPASPICNPGLETIRAAIYYKESAFWYYLSKPDGETVFSKTLQEHNIAKKKYLK